jgi:hypothetical protein
MLLWVYARQCARLRNGADASNIPPSDVYRPFVRTELHRADVLPVGKELTEHSSPEASADGFSNLGGKVVGLVLVRPLWVEGITTYLDRRQRYIRDYFMMTKLNHCPLMFLKFWRLLC